ncbi:glycoside hydrolase family 16 protein [Atractiella rhizophila]|nr:glycoside hydrolase family 16 protein [Atractiella rhizophila]
MKSIAFVSLLSVAVVALDNRNYNMVKEYTTYNGQNFLDGWNFESYPNGEPTHGLVNYIGDRNQAANLGLAVINSQNHAILTVDSYSNLAYGAKRNSIRLSSQQTFGVGSLVVLNAWHVPFGCSVWPAFWLVGPNWPNGGELDILEGARNQANNQATLHTTAGCTLRTPMAGSGQVLQSDCNTAVNSNAGCGVLDTSANSYGQGASNVQGGIWAMLYDTTGVYYWHWPRNQIPASLADGSVNPNPTTFGTPIGRWDSATCNMNHFQPQNIVFDITLCGDWAGAVSGSMGCGDCTAWVQQGSNYRNAYFEVQWVRVFQ